VAIPFIIALFYVGAVFVNLIAMLAIWLFGQMVKMKKLCKIINL